jgi:predicted DNA-binding transcriptional regulator AlpA
VKEWIVTFEVKTNKKVDPEDVVEQLADNFASVSFGDGMLSTTATVEAAGPMQAYDYLYEALSEFVSGKAWAPVRTEIMTPGRQDEELEAPPFPEVVGLVEIADMAGRSRQRAYQMANENKTFPAPIIVTRSGKLWLKAAVERYFAERKVGRPLSRESAIAAIEAAYAAQSRRHRRFKNEAEAWKATKRGDPPVLLGKPIYGQRQRPQRLF